ncbi:MAG: NAD(+) diphosphatase [Treponema sp.]|nr:NAD(+) diphosphatase [Treponema sp.]
MISNQNNVFCEHHYIFRGNNIILQDGKLPSEDILRKCLEHQVASDWFAETNYNFSALLMENDAPNPAGCTDIPLREYFYLHRDEEEEIFLVSRAKTLLNFRAEKRFCSRCGSFLEDDSFFTARICPKCSHQFFPQLEPAIIVLVSKGDEILLARHKNRIDTIFTCIAGFVEAGETIEHAVAREIKEETNIDVKDIRYVASQAWPYPDQLMFAFRAEYAGGSIQVQNEELHEAHWYKRNALPAIPKPGSVAYRLITGEFD